MFLDGFCKEIRGRTGPGVKKQGAGAESIAMATTMNVTVVSDALHVKQKEAGMKPALRRVKEADLQTTFMKDRDAIVVEVKTEICNAIHLRVVWFQPVTAVESVESPI